MILIGLGGNLNNPIHGPPRVTLEVALRLLKDHDVEIVRRSRWYRSRPVPDDGQPWYVNGAAVVVTGRPPADLLQRLIEVERQLGRLRSRPNAPRTVDLDLLAYCDIVTQGSAVPVLPHPRLHERAFVLVPVAEIAPDWRHPVLERTARELLAALPYKDPVEPLPD